MDFAAQPHQLAAVLQPLCRITVIASDLAQTSVNSAQSLRRFTPGQLRLELQQILAEQGYDPELGLHGRQGTRQPAGPEQRAPHQPHLRNAAGADGRQEAATARPGSWCVCRAIGRATTPGNSVRINTDGSLRLPRTNSTRFGACQTTRQFSAMRWTCPILRAASAPTRAGRHPGRPAGVRQGTTAGRGEHLQLNANTRAKLKSKQEGVEERDVKLTPDKIIGTTAPSPSRLRRLNALDEALLAEVNGEARRARRGAAGPKQAGKNAKPLGSPPGSGVIPGLTLRQRANKLSDMKIVVFNPKTGTKITRQAGPLEAARLRRLNSEQFCADNLEVKSHREFRESLAQKSRQ